jgi:hypothetical protein
MPRKAEGLRPLTPAERQARQRKVRSDELKRLRAFVQWVADYSNDPAVVREAKAHGAK